jgi:hypothetical protein
MAAMTIPVAHTPLWLLQDENVGASSSSWGLPVKGINFVCPGVAQQDGRIIES